MNRSVPALLAIVALAVAACGLSSPFGSTATPGSPSPGGTNVLTPSSFTPGDSNDVGRFFKISEVGLGPSGWVTLVNYTDTAASLQTLFLCQADGCVDLPDYRVDPGQAARIAVGDGSGLEAVAMTGADLTLNPPDGEVALYSIPDITDPAGLRTYLEWGKTPHTITQLAIDTGIWLTGSYAPTSPAATRLFQNDNGLWLFDE